MNDAVRTLYTPSTTLSSKFNALRETFSPSQLQTTLRHAHLIPFGQRPDLQCLSVVEMGALKPPSLAPIKCHHHS